MALIRYNPWTETNSLQRQLNQIFNDAFTSENWENANNLAKVPAAELTQTEEGLHLKLEVPGMEAEDLDIQVMKDRVAISGERKSETKSEEKSKTRTEFRYGKFSRVIPLPIEIDNTNVTAEYKNGILNLTLPKSEAEKNKVVKVSLSEANS